jgi:hypothetical protein
MLPADPRWHPIEPPGTYLQFYGDSFPGFEDEPSYSIAALRRVTHPSLTSMLEDAVAAAAAVLAGPPDPTRISMVLYSAAASLPEENCAMLATRRPNVVIPFVGIAGQVLAPYQLLGDVPCIRLYDMELEGELAKQMYAMDHRGVAPEDVFTPEVMRAEFSVRYVDCLWERPDQPWPSSPLTLIANSIILHEGYLEMDRSGCESMVKTLMSMPELPPEKLQRLPEVPKSHADRVTAMLMHYALRLA